MESTETWIAPQKKGKLSRSHKVEEIRRAVNLFLNAQGKNGIRVYVSEGNVVIALDDSALDSVDIGPVEDLTMTICQTVDGVPTAVERVFVVRPVPPE